MTSVRDDSATIVGSATIVCPVCGAGFEPEGRQRFCSAGCRQQT